MKQLIRVCAKCKHLVNPKGRKLGPDTEPADVDRTHGFCAQCYLDQSTDDDDFVGRLEDLIELARKPSVPV